MLPAATDTVSVAGLFMLHVISGEVTDVTGELLTGWRTAVVEIVLPAIKVFQMSISVLVKYIFDVHAQLTVSRCSVH